MVAGARNIVVLVVVVLRDAIAGNARLAEPVALGHASHADAPPVPGQLTAIADEERVVIVAQAAYFAFETLKPVDRPNLGLATGGNSNFI
jgi:hypothetical protein